MPPLPWRAAAAAVALLVAVPVGAGLVGILLPAFGYLPALGHETVSLAPWRALLAAPSILESAAVSALTGFAATAISVALTLVVLAAAFGSRGLAIVERLLAPILSVPHAAAALGFAFLVAPSGLLARLASPWLTGWEVPPDLLVLRDPWGWSMTAALVAKEVPFLFLMALAALPQAKAREHWLVARSLGYGRMAAFAHGVWPLLYRQMRLPVLAVLAFSATTVEVALILGPTTPPPLAVRVIDWLGAASLDGWLVGSAAALATVALVAALALAWRAVEMAAGRGARALRRQGLTARGDAPIRWAVFVLTVVAVAAAFAGFGGLVLQSVAGYWPFPSAWPSAVSLAAWTGRLPVTAGLLATTAALALAATAIALPLAVLLVEAERRGVRIGAVVWLPLVAPQVAFLFGLTVLAIATGAGAGACIVTLGHALFVLPYAALALAGPWGALDGRYEAVAASLGAGPWRRFIAVRLPMMTGPLLVASALSVAVSVGLYLPTQLLGAGRVETVTTAAVTAAAGADRRLVGVTATLQLLLPFAAFAVARAVPAVLFRHRRGMLPGRAAR
jgi:putative thiamine transport system permease protein